ncbi:MAG: PAS domain-containing protein, partial [Lachnospiraceae bacterium]|nr:PAS domain-containing protein [Lachnospiraceae bacterium]
MYTCRLHIYFAGRPCHSFEVIKKMPALEYFTHSFSESDEADPRLSKEADLILADLSHMELPDALQVLMSNLGTETHVILLADKSQLSALFADPTLSGIADIWVGPMSDEELRFRFLRWQQTCKMSKDFWQTSQYLEAAINNIPNLIWYKDKDGVHEKVNDSFCRTVNKTKQQVEGQRHAYIWDVEEDDPACIESEHQVMSSEQTLVSEETIKTGDGMRTLTTYKSPLYNLDGSVMGTVGVGIDVTQERAYEQEIVKKNQTLETIFANIECGVIMHTLDGSQILSVNAMALKILGYEDRKELEQDGFHLISPSVIEEDRDKLLQGIKTLTKAGDTVNVEYRVRHNDGKLLDVMGSIKLLEKNGELFYQRFLLDCTAQKQQERENERRQMGLVQALSVDFNLICFVDSETGLIMLIRSNGSEKNYNFDNTLSLQENLETYIQEQVYED